MQPCNSGRHRDQPANLTFFDRVIAMTELREFLTQHATAGLLSADCLPEAKVRFALSDAELEGYALQASLLPPRYQRNRNSIAVSDQLKLFSSKVAVVGCGGLGGYIIEQLARLGVGELLLIDPDCFEDHNLNRQLYSSPEVIGQAKAAVAARRVQEINPAVRATPIQQRLSSANGRELLSGCQVVADAVDNLTARRELAEICASLNIPLVHGAIAGWYGQVCTIYPGDPALEKIYGSCRGNRGIEQELGNPSFTPAMIASLEVAEICKVLLGKAELLRNRKLTIDLLHMEIEEVPL